MDRYWKKVSAILTVMAKEDPNRFICEVYYSGMEGEEIQAIKWLVDIARRAQGYDVNHDQLRICGIL